MDVQDSAKQTLAGFIKEHDLSLDVNVRCNVEPQSKFYASISRLEVIGNGVLTSSYGNGRTIKSALRDLANEIQGQLITTGGRSSERKEIRVPLLTTIGNTGY